MKINKKNKKTVYKIYTEAYDSIFNKSYGKSMAEKSEIEKDAVLEGINAVISHFERDDSK